MIRIEHATLTYPGDTSPVLRDISLAIGEGEFVLVIGPTGSGKSSLLRLINGLAPHHTGGTLAGDVQVDGRSIRDSRPRDLATVVGVVGQDPMEGFVSDIVEEEIAFGMEAQGLAPEVMRKRVEEILDLLALAPLRRRVLSTLSGGEQQRVAIAAALVTNPRVLILDEPTSALDPNAADEVLSTVHRLVHDLGITVVMAEHRLERVIHFVDRVVHVLGDGTIKSGTAPEMMADSPLTPPVIELARLAGWSPLPLTVRDARRMAEPLRRQLAAAAPVREARTAERPPLVSTSRLTVRFGSHTALRSIDASVRPGEIVAVMGRNGAGKSTLLTSMVGLRQPSSGQVRLGGHEPSALEGSALIHLAGLVPQEAADLLYSESVATECALSDRDAGAVSGSTRALVDLLAPEIEDDQHPRDLSEGQRLALALAIVLAASPPLVLLDEPTRGLDYQAKARLATALRRLAHEGHGIVFATHDVELVAEVATRVVVLADGEVVADGPTREVVIASPALAPQVAKILAPAPWLTVADVAAALENRHP
jgi:energy-coupling factor transport system ATP-binding protein